VPDEGGGATRIGATSETLAGAAGPESVVVGAGWGSVAVVSLVFSAGSAFLQPMAINPQSKIEIGTIARIIA